MTRWQLGKRRAFRRKRHSLSPLLAPSLLDGGIARAFLSAQREVNVWQTRRRRQGRRERAEEERRVLPAAAARACCRAHGGGGGHEVWNDDDALLGRASERAARLVCRHPTCCRHRGEERTQLRPRGSCQQSQCERHKKSECRNGSDIQRVKETDEWAMNIC